LAAASTLYEQIKSMNKKTYHHTLRAFAEMTDAIIIDGKLPRFGSLTSLVKEMPSHWEIADYRPEHPSVKALAEISRLLAQSRSSTLELGDCDILIDPRKGESWMRTRRKSRPRSRSLQ
jgi:hypothetical protein